MVLILKDHKASWEMAVSQKIIETMVETMADTLKKTGTQENDIIQEHITGSFVCPKVTGIFPLPPVPEGNLYGEPDG